VGTIFFCDRLDEKNMFLPAERDTLRGNSNNIAVCVTIRTDNTLSLLGEIRTVLPTS
jgi:hypothetical protein